MLGVFRLMLALALCMALWLAIPSRLFFNPTSVAIDGYTVNVARTSPLHPVFGDPYIRYVETVRALDRKSQPCTDTNAFRYDLSEPIGTWSIEEWAAPCMNGAYHWRASWQVYLLDIIPLRPVEIDRIVNPKSEADG